MKTDVSIELYNEACNAGEEHAKRADRLHAELAKVTKERDRWASEMHHYFRVESLKDIPLLVRQFNEMSADGNRNRELFEKACDLLDDFPTKDDVTTYATTEKWANRALAWNTRRREFRAMYPTGQEVADRFLQKMVKKRDAMKAAKADT